MADNTSSVAGLADAGRTAEELGAHRKVRLIIYRPSDGPLEAAVFFDVGGFTFGYSPDRGAKYVTARLSESPLRLASIWCHETVVSAEERDVLKGQAALGQCPNGCLIDALVRYDQLPSTLPEANGKASF